MTETVEQTLAEAGYSSGEIAVFKRWWETGEGYEDNRELIDQISEYRFRTEPDY